MNPPFPTSIAQQQQQPHQQTMQKRLANTSKYVYFNCSLYGYHVGRQDESCLLFVIDIYYK